MGVRSSWLMFARNCALDRAAAAELRVASSRSSSDLLEPEMVERSTREIAAES